MRVRPPAVAGMFYPGESGRLRSMIGGFLDEARGALSDFTSVRAVIVPHAGYVYSGSTAALAYAGVETLADTVKHVVIVGPTHRVGIHGIALVDADAMATPLGNVALWTDGVERALKQPQVVVSAAVHQDEHSLEVQVPFLQVVLPDADILPLAAGWVEPDAVTRVLDAVWGPDTLVVISSDLSHYHLYDEARQIDQASVNQILNRDPSLDHDQACGATGVNALALAARDRHLRPQLLGMCNSGDTASDKHRVVGYAALCFHAEQHGQEELR